MINANVSILLELPKPDCFASLPKKFLLRACYKNFLLKLSIIIVNYNVKYFLEQCLCSVKKAIEKIQAEVFVVDNNSSDGSLDYLMPKFPFVQFLINKENVGFSKANNKALAAASGEYILFLNPDTIVAEDSFEKSISFLESNSACGALGVKMIDGSGNYLKESKRGFPSLWVSFCKLSGLTAAFPQSKIFSKYYLGNLSEKENQIIDAISGAFFFTKKNVLEKIGGFDEQFFMYAEDLDLSYRIQQAGHKNYYLSETTIIHFKGESTKKDFRYVKSFYTAMNQFSKKHFKEKVTLIPSPFITLAIWARSKIAIAINFLSINRAKPILENQKLYLCGDENSILKVKTALKKSSKMFVSEENCADTIIFCAGDSYSFEKIIISIQKPRKKQFFGFHCAGTSSIVGSSKKTISGETYLLYP